MTAMANPPASTKSSLAQRVAAHARDRWPELRGTQVRFRGTFAYIDAHLPDGTVSPLCRLRYCGSANRWGFAIYRASHDDYQDNVLPRGSAVGTPEQALDCACVLYLNDATDIHPPLQPEAQHPAAWQGDAP